MELNSKQLIPTLDMDHISAHQIFEGDELDLDALPMLFLLSNNASQSIPNE